MKRASGYRANGLAALMAVLLAAKATAADNADPHDISYGFGNPVAPDDATLRALAYAGDDRPVWLDRVLGRLKTAKAWRRLLVQHMLFRRDGHPSFLALIWERSERGRLFELYRISVATSGNVRLRFVRALESELLDIVEPSGSDVNGDGIPVLFLQYGSGGSGHEGYGLRVYRLSRSSVDVTPDRVGRAKGLTDLEDAAGNRVAVLVVSDDRWAGFFLGCGACGPHIPILMVWEGDRYTPACRRFPRYYGRRRESLANGASYGENLGSDPLWNGIEDTLLLLQMGRPEQARARYRSTLSQIRRDLPIGFEELRQVSFSGAWWLEKTKAAFDPVVEAAARSASLPCPLLGYE